MRESSQNSPTSGVVVRIIVASVFSKSIVRLNAWAVEAFSLQIPGARVLTAEYGRLDSHHGQIDAESRDGKHEVSLELLNVFEETRVAKGEDVGPENFYGMRFFPFISSRLAMAIHAQGVPIGAVLVDLPDSYRVIWYGANVVGAGGTPADLSASIGDRRLVYVFDWKTAQDACVIDVPVRFSGRHLTELVRYPAYYWGLALTGIALLAGEGARVLMGSVLAVWVFMFREWRRADVPQRHTILLRAYLLGGALTFIWAMACLALGPWAVLAAIIPGAVIWNALRWTRTFEETGRLPDSVAFHWRREVRRADRKQKEAVKKDPSTRGH